MSRAEFYRLMSYSIRSALSDPLTPAERAGACHTARIIALNLGRHNTKFDHARFLRDCGVTEGPTAQPAQPTQEHAP